MWFTRLAIHRPILIWMALAAIAVLGLQAYTRLPAELTPRADIPILTVTTIYPGAGPPEVEAQVSKPLEDAVGSVGGVEDVYSSSQANVSIIRMDFKVGTDLETAVNEVRSRVDQARPLLPTDARPPIVAKLDIGAQPILQFGLESETRSLQQLRALADNTLAPRLERVTGVASVQVVGGAQREIHVDADNAKLAHYHLTIADVVNSLKAAGRDVPGGTITQGTKETGVRLAAAFTSLDAIRNTQIVAPQLAAQASSQQPSQAMGGSSLGMLPVPPLTVADVATVSDGEAARTEINRINGREGVSLLLAKATDANTVKVADAVRELIQTFQSETKDVNVVTLRDSSIAVRDALDDVNVSLVLGALLAMVVILLFLHNLRGTLIVSLAIPACIVATFLVLGFAGFTLNQMTLLALSLSVGILVDDSIVVLESITRHLRQGEPPVEAALNGRAEIGFADLTTTLVDVVVFVPIAFMGGVVGGFFKQFGLTIVTATLFSLVISFSVTPMLAARWYRAGEKLEARRGVYMQFERMYRALESGYRRVLRWSLAHPIIVLVSGVFSLALIFWLTLGKVGTELVPGIDQGILSVDIELPPGSSLAATDSVARRVEGIVAKTPEVRAVVTNVGQILGGFGSIPQQGAQFAQVNIQLKDKRGALDSLFHPGSNARTRSDEAVAFQLRKPLEQSGAASGARVTTLALRTMEGVEQPIQIELRGADSDHLTQVAAQLLEAARTIPGIQNPDITARTGQPEIRAVVSPARAAQFGVPSAQAGEIVRTAIAGNTDTNFRAADGQAFPIRVRAAGLQRNDPADVGNVVVGSDTQGQPVFLADIAEITRRVSPTNIERSNGQRVVTLNADVTSSVPLSTVQEQLSAKARTLIPPDINWRWSGETQTVEESATYFANALILAILLVYMVMASLFNSLKTPFVIMFTLPMALIGAFGALVLTGENLSLVSGIGILMLTGLMGRNAILLLDYTNTLRERGLERLEAIEEAGATRLRPILMTTTATIVGMLPVALRIGRASEIRAPMAIVVIGGLVVSTVLTLVVIPVVYNLFETRFGLKRAKSEAQSGQLVPEE